MRKAWPQVLIREGQEPVVLVVEADNLQEACGMLGGEMELECARAFIRFSIEQLLGDRRWQEWTEEKVVQSFLEDNLPRPRVFEFTPQLLFLTFSPGQEYTRLEFSSPSILRKS